MADIQAVTWVAAVGRAVATREERAAAAVGILAAVKLAGVAAEREAECHRSPTARPHPQRKRTSLQIVQ